MRIIKYEEVYLHVCRSVPEDRTAIRKYLIFYNTKKPHSSLDEEKPIKVTSTYDNQS
ncbi:MAG: transposase [Rhizobiaceae bacterium]|nr:transposase [Rhizobiaceae bacterium]